MAFTLQLPTLDHVLQQILSLKSPRLMKADIACAFRNVPVDPRDAIKCGIQHEGQFYIDKRLVFGAVNGTMIFQRISDAVRFILAQSGLTVWNYIDDMLAAVEEIGATEKLDIDIEFKKDLRWFKLFLTSFNGCTSFSNRVGLRMLHRCVSHGFGGSMWPTVLFSALAN